MNVLLFSFTGYPIASFSYFYIDLAVTAVFVSDDIIYSNLNRFGLLDLKLSSGSQRMKLFKTFQSGDDLRCSERVSRSCSACASEYRTWSVFYCSPYFFQVEQILFTKWIVIFIWVPKKTQLNVCKSLRGITLEHKINYIMIWHVLWASGSLSIIR